MSWAARLGASIVAAAALTVFGWVVAAIFVLINEVVPLWPMGAIVFAIMAVVAFVGDIIYDALRRRPE